MQNFSEKVNQASDDKLGQHLVANMEIEPGETILEEKPRLVVPHWDCDQMKCAQCMQESYIMCKKCQMFPLCMDCQEHASNECEFFSSGAGAKISKNLLVKNYPIYGLVKLLLLMEATDTSSACDSLNVQQVQLENYRDTEMWQEHDEQVVAPLIQSGLLEVFSKIKLDSEQLHKLCIVIDMHAFEVTARDGDSLKGVYVCGAQLPHHCVPNTVVSLDEDFNMKIYAAVYINAGEIIYNSYANPLMGTSQRQHQLRISRRFDCMCSRCLDPIERGTHMSTIKCKLCDNGYAICQLETEERNWKCTLCSGISPAIEVHKLLATLGEAMVGAEGDLEMYEKLLDQYSDELHPNHFLLLDIKQNIAAILRAAIFMNSMHDPGKKLLARRVEICSDLLPVARAVVPGLSKLYAIALHEYLVSFLELTDLEFRLNDISKEGYKYNLQKAKDISEKALELLFYEPNNSQEGHLAERISVDKNKIVEELKKLGSQ